MNTQERRNTMSCTRDKIYVYQQWLYAYVKYMSIPLSVFVLYPKSIMYNDLSVGTFNVKTAACFILYTGTSTVSIKISRNTVEIPPKSHHIGDYGRGATMTTTPKHSTEIYSHWVWDKWHFTLLPFRKRNGFTTCGAHWFNTERHTLLATLHTALQWISHASIDCGNFQSKSTTWPHRRCPAHAVAVEWRFSEHRE